MSRIHPPEPLSVAELVHFGPLGRARAFATENLDQQVSGVSLVSELDQVRQCEPNAALVLHREAAHSAWALESALRLAWERNASCVVAPAEIAVTSSTSQLAERLRMPLFVVDDPAKHALELSAAIADTEATRARLTARCAVLFGERSSTRDIIGVINSEVPGVSAALVTEDGHLIAGRSAAGRPDAGAHRVRIPVPGPDGRPWAMLVAQLAAWSPSWVDTVETILRLARAPLTVSIARSRLDLTYQAAKDRLLLETLLRDEPSEQGEGGAGSDRPEAEQRAREAGWRIDGQHVAVFLLPAERTTCDVGTATPGVVAAWQETFANRPIIPLQRGWVSWWTDDAGEPKGVAEQVRRRLATMGIPIPLTAGIGQSGNGVPGLRRSLAEAGLAAAVASRLGGGAVEVFAELGPRVVLACLPVADIAAAARVALADLVAAPDTDVLVTTLAALMDCAGSTGQAAARLGVHRNTVLGRIERIRSRGVELNSPDQRLALHVACYALLSTKQPGYGGQALTP